MYVKCLARECLNVNVQTDVMVEAGQAQNNGNVTFTFLLWFLRTYSLGFYVLSHRVKATLRKVLGDILSMMPLSVHVVAGSCTLDSFAFV